MSYWHEQQRQLVNAIDRVVAGKTRKSTKRRRQWAPWNNPVVDDRALMSMFCMCRKDFWWLVAELQAELQLELAGAGSHLRFLHKDYRICAHSGYPELSDDGA
ncbi:hypothetical protein BDK51DRAFT_30274 [Blyttiomyces helicus]|uniref:Uncharacterized protein n=1 Tax=Blyttiomyces helicus TaxID=388810 RepID=A0A4P9W5T5_9FUNG|nr:hypothetical protein BDK51DRAFT_30274 [Blyttiomyces helicus]|eukprot:RKO86685.1 hypothetical protein BDK51DRAFT_30274 [Blyttiomyces helicus]